MTVRRTTNQGLSFLDVTTPLCTASLCLQGAHLTSWKPAGHEECLFLSPNAAFVPGKAIRGGIPVCWPWFGPREGAPSHGIARTSEWHLHHQEMDKCGNVLLSLAFYPEDEIKSAGIVELDVPRRYLEVREAVTIETKGGSILTILPSKQFRVSVTCVGPENRITQYFDSVITPETYEKELAPARTFTFYEDIKPLLEKGLIKGGSLENAVVIRGEELMSKEPMRFINEFARHKAMDLIGDLTLCGKPILGHVIAIKPGHGPNTELTAKLKKEHHRNQQMAPNPVNVPYGDAVLDINEVMSLLPHRYPFLMVDRIIGFEGETKCRGLKNLTMNELFFQGHFPGHPVMPGVLQVEAMAQVASIVMLRQPGNASKLGYFMSADKVKFRRVVVPGDTLIIEAELTKMRGNIGQATARCLVNGQVVSEAELKFGLQDA